MTYKIARRITKTNFERRFFDLLLSLSKIVSYILSLNTIV